MVPNFVFFESSPELLIHSLEKESQEQKSFPQDEHFHDLEFVLPRVQKLEPLERSTRIFGRRLFTSSAGDLLWAFGQVSSAVDD